MHLKGTLNGFPLPEVLLFLGNRTGCLRVCDVPQCSDMELDLAEGRANALHIASCSLTEKSEIVNLLGVIVEAGEGSFEFNDRPIVKVESNPPLLINDLVMSMVIHVDLKLSRRRGELSSDELYVLVTPVPKIWIDPTLKAFYDQGLECLKDGASAKDLAHQLGLENDAIRVHLTYLRQLGFLKIIEGKEADALRQRKLQHHLSEKSQLYQFAAEASDLIRRTGKLILRTGDLWKPTPLVLSEKQPDEVKSRRAPPINSPH
jgi:hypothetical protein